MDWILRIFTSLRDEHKVGCYCENRKAIPFRATSPLYILVDEVIPLLKLINGLTTY